MKIFTNVFHNFLYKLSIESAVTFLIHGSITPEASVALDCSLEVRRDVNKYQKNKNQEKIRARLLQYMFAETSLGDMEYHLSSRDFYPLEFAGDVYVSTGAGDVYVSTGADNVSTAFTAGKLTGIFIVKDGYLLGHDSCERMPGRCFGEALRVAVTRMVKLEATALLKDQDTILGQISQLKTIITHNKLNKTLRSCLAELGEALDDITYSEN